MFQVVKPGIKSVTSRLAARYAKHFVNEAVLHAIKHNCIFLKLLRIQNFYYNSNTVIASIEV